MRLCRPWAAPSPVMNEHPKKITLSIDSRLENVCLIGWAVRGICSSLSLPEEKVFCVELAVCEAVNNSIEHAYGNQPEHTIEVHIKIYHHQMRIQIMDSGQEFDPSPHKEIRTVHRSDNCSCIPERGRGLTIISSVMDAWSLTRTLHGVNILTMTKHFN